ncbi:MAG: glutathionylspermidine synthase family protein [Hyphomicrobiaceae bacterium]
MRRIAVAERADWRARADDLGFIFHTLDGKPYWDETAYWSFSLSEIERDLEDPTAELDDLCRLAVDRVIRDERYLRALAIPEPAWGIVADSFRRGDPTLYGRMDFSYNGTGPAKLLEYNADTPTALYETAVFQWHWLEDMKALARLPADADQFNSLHERLVTRFAELAGQGVLHLTAAPQSDEDRGTVAYVEECAREGGFATQFIAVEDIGRDARGQLVDLANKPIHRLFKLYPWEWLLREEFGPTVASSRTGFLEPLWKAVVSNKGLLPVLWEMAPGHPNLLEAYFEDDPRATGLTSYARKPILSREGANITLVMDGRTLESGTGPYGGEGYVRQALAPLAESGGNHAVIGSWVIAGQPAGIGIREDESAITRNTSRFVPHAIVG